MRTDGTVGKIEGSTRGPRGPKKGYYEIKDNGKEDEKDLRNLPRLMRESTCSARDSKSRLTKKTSDSDRQVSHVSFITTIP